METDGFLITGGPLKEGEYVLIKSYMTAGDERWIQNHAARAEKGKDSNIIMTVGDIQFATFHRMVLDWRLFRTLKRADGVIQQIEIPFDKKNIEDIKRPVYRYVLRKIDELNPEEGEEDEDFLADATDSSETSLPRMNTHR